MSEQQVEVSSSGLAVRALCKTDQTTAGRLEVLRGVELELAPGEAVAVTGPSGSGKSTLLHILGTLERPTAGTVRLGGVNPFELSERQLAAFRNSKIGFVFQDHHLLPHCSALENVLIPTLAGGLGRREAESRARQLLERVGLGKRLNHLPAALSGGERQRVAIARALINRPSLVLADEPTGNLDRRSAATVAELFLELQGDQRHMLLLVTHSIELAGRFPTRFELADGTLKPAGE